MKKLIWTFVSIIVILCIGFLIFVKDDKTSQNNFPEIETESYTQEETQREDKKETIPDKIIPKSDYSTQKPAESKITVSYMCGEKVKIFHEQDSPSLPPRISYIRVSDGASIASYGDFGAYIRPEYFSIDRAQIEEGYSFNETNFCKYLKN